LSYASSYMLIVNMKDDDLRTCGCGVKIEYS
jgi:hypothetical protein